MSNLQERRNSLLAIMKHRQKNPKSSEQEGASKDSCGMKSYKDLIERMKGQSSFSRDTDQREQTLEHPLPRDAGPPGLRATDPSQANLFKRLGALTGFPSGSVNDSIMASWMTSALSASSTKNNNSGKVLDDNFGLFIYFCIKLTLRPLLELPKCGSSNKGSQHNYFLLRMERSYLSIVSNLYPYNSKLCTVITIHGQIGGYFGVL